MDDFIFPLGIRIYFDTQLQFVQLTADIKQDGFGLNLYIPNQYIDQLEGLSLFEVNRTTFAFVSSKHFFDGASVRCVYSLIYLPEFEKISSSVFSFA